MELDPKNPLGNIAGKLLETVHEDKRGILNSIFSGTGLQGLGGILDLFPDGKKGGSDTPDPLTPDMSKVPEVTTPFNQALSPDSRAQLLAVMMKRSRNGGQMPPEDTPGA